MDLRPFMGMPDWVKQTDPRAHAWTSYLPRAMERRQLDDAIALTQETREYLYSDYTPSTCRYEPGTRPLLEAVVRHACEGCATDREKVIRLVTWRRANHTHVGKCGLGTEEEIILGGYSMCHDASRTLITLCHVAGLGARMVLGLNDKARNGHTLTEVFFDGQWALVDPSPTMPFAWCRTSDDRWLSAWDLQTEPQLVNRCEPFLPVTGSRGVDWYANLFANTRLVNYSLEESSRFMALRFTRMVTAMKVVENYDYHGHLTNKPVGFYADLDELAQQWLQGTKMPAAVPASAAD